MAIPNYSTPIATACASDAKPITPSDSATFAPTRGVWVGGAGNLAVTMLDGTVATFGAVTAGTLLNINVTKVMATSTTATLIVALY